jgi:hypothetical protein
MVPTLWPRISQYSRILAGVGAWLFATTAFAAAPNSLILNEGNAVNGAKFLSNGATDATLGRLEGNGQNWLEFLVVQGDDLGGGAFANTLDLRGWTINWSYDKQDPANPNQFGSGVIQFTNEPLWAAMPRGTMLSVSEWKQAWYLINTPAGYDPAGAGGLKRDGGINGVGVSHGNRYNSAIDTLRTFTTNTSWNPGANGGGTNGDWGIHVFAGDRNPDSSFKYFNFSGSVTVGSTTSAIGTDAGGLFAVNNDNWQYTIKDADGHMIQGPIGEQGAVPGSTFGVSSQETLQLNAFDQNAHPTQANYLATALAH